MVTRIVDNVINPGRMTNALLKPVGWMEPKEVHKIIDLLKDWDLNNRRNGKLDYFCISISRLSPRFKNGEESPDSKGQHTG